MATTPGLLSDWPWKPLGNFKYLILAPWVVHSVYSYVTKDEGERDLSYLIVLPMLLSRMLHHQLWISLSRYQTAKGKNRIVDKSIEFDQVDRERNWDDHIIFSGLLLYLANNTQKGGSHMPIWRTDGVLITIFLHVGAVEFLYYWFHRALHHHFLYSRYHSHHHSSIATEPVTSVTHPFAENMAYFVLFSIPTTTMLFTGTGSIAALSGYLFYIDFMNMLGHCNFELVPSWLFAVFPPLKYLMYTPSFHSLHHTQFRTNYALFMPFYDYIYGTVDKTSDTLYETSLQRVEDLPDIVHLTHLTTPGSIYHIRLGFASLASKPQTSYWYLWLMWPVTLWSMFVTWIYGRAFVVERNLFKHLNLQTWAIPKYLTHYSNREQREKINKLIEEAILEAEKRGAKVLTLGLLNQGEELNRSGELFIRRHPKLKVKLVDGSSLSAAIIINSIPKETMQVVLRGSLNKVAYAVAAALCQKNIQVIMNHEDDFRRVKERLDSKVPLHNLVLSESCAPTIWLVGERLSHEDYLKATQGTIFIPFSQFPLKKERKDCLYLTTPAMLTPKHLENVDSCENWLPRRVMSAGRIAGIVHALEGWDEHECGDVILNVDKVWEASLRHGFQPLQFDKKEL